MDVVLGGALELAFARAVCDAEGANPGAHVVFGPATSRKEHLDRAATFAAIADNVLVHPAIWNHLPNTSTFRAAYGVQFTGAGGAFIDKETSLFVGLALKGGAFRERRAEMIARGDIALGAVLFQMRAAREAGAFLVLPEEDLLALQELIEWVKQSGCPAPVDLPDVTGLLIDANSFAGGIFNFSPPDILSLPAIRSDEKVKKYAAEIKGLLKEEAVEAREAKMLRAMVDAYQREEASVRSDKVFEVMSWTVKPLHYVPVVDAILTLGEDLKDLAVRWSNRNSSTREWHLIAVRMTDIAVRDYIRRKDNSV